MNQLNNFTKGIIKENPVLVLVLGTCPTLATSTNVTSALGMGAAATVVLLCSNIVISALRKVIPDKVRIPCYIVLIAGFVTMVQMLVKAFAPALDQSLGIYLPLIVVNCIILGRAEAYASSHPVIPSIFDGLGMGLGFTLGLTLIGILRELLGAGTVFGVTVTKELWNPIAIFTSNPGAFFVLAFIVAGINAFAIRKAKKKGEKPKLRRIDSCAGCTNMACQGRKFYEEDAADKNVGVKQTTDVKKVADKVSGAEQAVDKATGVKKKAEEAEIGKTVTVKSTTGKETIGKETIGKETTGKETTGKETAESAGKPDKASEKKRKDGE